MEIGIAEQIFTGVAQFWLGLLAISIPLMLLRRIIFN